MCCGFWGFSTEEKLSNGGATFERHWLVLAILHEVGARGSHYPVFDGKVCVCGFTHGLWEESVLPLSPANFCSMLIGELDVQVRWRLPTYQVV